MRTEHIRVYSDGSFANNRDFSSQLGHVVIIKDGSGASCLLSFRSYKCRRMVRSVLASETCAFVDGFDSAFLLQAQLTEIFDQRFPIRAFVDSKSLFDVITKGTMTTERMLMVDLLVLKEAYDKGEIADLGWIQSLFNIADAMTKECPNDTLWGLLKKNGILHPIGQWVIRDKMFTQKQPGQSEA